MIEYLHGSSFILKMVSSLLSPCLSHLCSFLRESWSSRQSGRALLTMSCDQTITFVFLLENESGLVQCILGLIACIQVLLFPVHSSVPTQETNKIQYRRQHWMKWMLTDLNNVERKLEVNFLLKTSDAIIYFSFDAII